MTTKKLVTLDGVEYDAATFNEEQIHFVDHCADLEQKIIATNFKLQQLQVAKNAFIMMLKTSLGASNGS